MNSLTITQKTSETERYIPNEVIMTLYNIGKDDDEKQTLTSGVDTTNSNRPVTSVAGSVAVRAAYANQIDYLAVKFPNLNISTDSTYIYFEDSVVEDILKSNGFSTDGIGISTADALQKTSIPGNLFKQRTDITTFRELSYFRNLQYINDDAFRDCTNLETISLPQSLVSIGRQAFENTKLTGLDVNLPALTNITWGAFRNTNIKKVSNLGLISVLNESVFSGCASLISINLPITCTTLQKHTIDECSQLKDVNVENIVTIYGRNFAGCKNLTKPLHFKSLESINLNESGHFTCQGCLYIYLPKLIDGCGGYDLGGNNVRGLFVISGWSNLRSPFNIVYFRDLTTLKTGMFSGCTIRNLIINNQTPPSVTVFDSDKQTTLFTSNSSTQVLNIYVPDDSVDSYKSAPYWSELANKYKPISSLNKVATVELFNALSDENKADTLIEEYM